MSLFCEQCGKQATTPSKFCTYCGYSLSLGNNFPTELNLPSNAPAVTAFKATAVSDHNLDPAVTSGASARRTNRLVTSVLTAVGALVVGLAAGLALREMGVLNFALGEKVSVNVAAKQAESAYKIGYEEGETQGLKSGEEEGYNIGFEAGDASGYERGYGTGMDVGFIDAKTGMTPTDIGDFILTAEWVFNIGGDNVEGICLYANGNSLPEWDKLKWAFISPSGTIDFFSDSNNTYNCLENYFISQRVGSLSRYNRLAVYLTANGKTDRWGPLPIPTP